MTWKVSDEGGDVKLTLIGLGSDPVSIDEQLVLTSTSA